MSYYLEEKVSLSKDRQLVLFERNAEYNLLAVTDDDLNAMDRSYWSGFVTMTITWAGHLSSDSSNQGYREESSK